MIRKGSCICLLLFIFLILQLTFLTGSSAVYAITHRMNKTVIILPLDYVKWEDFTDPRYPGFYLLMKNGSIGLMNTNTKLGHERWSEYASIATGEPTRFFPPHWIASPFSQYGYLRNQVNYPFAAILDSQSLSKEHTAFGFPLGRLAEYIESFGYSTWYIGSQQTSTQVLDPARLLVIKRNQIERHHVIDTVRNRYTIPNATSPYGMYDNIDRIAHDVKEALRAKRGGLLSIGLGDMARVKLERENVNSLQYEWLRRKAVSEIDRLLLELLHSLPSESTLIVTGIPLNTRSTLHDSLVPTAIIGASFTAGGLLTSTTTHRSGLIANVDLVPTILSQLGILHVSTLGNPVNSEAIQHGEGRIVFDNQARLNEMKVWNSWYTQHRPTWILTIGMCTVFTFTICIFSKWWRHKKYKYRHRESSLLVTVSLYSCIGLSLLPTLFILEASIIKKLQHGQHLRFISDDLLHAAVLLFLFMVVTYPAVLWFKSWNNRLLYISGIAVVIQVGLLLFQNGTFSQSFFGYDPVNGARYYGIGNEYMAGLVTAELMVMASSFVKFKRRLYWFHYVGACVFVLLLAAPNIGANMGGAFTAAIGNTVLIYRLRKGTWDRFGFIVCAGVAITTICCIIALHSIPSMYHTHTNKILHWIAVYQWHPIYRVILQKIELNTRIMFAQPIAVLLGVVVVSLLRWIMKNQNSNKRKQFANSGVTHLTSSILWTALVGSLTNDSGLVVLVLMVYSPLCLGIAWYVSNDGNLLIPPIKETLRTWIQKRSMV